MPANRNALIRYKTIDKCLQNRYRQWTLENLIDECSEALYEYEGIEKGISKRTVQLDIQIMRSDKLGYNAPIIVYDNKFYTYEDADYSITNIPLTDQDLDKLTETVELLKQFKGFSHFRELDSMVQKLEDHVYSHKTRQKPVIDFEKNENLKGLEHLEVLYQAIIQRRAILLTYQSFKARQAHSFNVYPYLLKEFRNRWFLIGATKQKKPILTLALDRIIDIKPSEVPFQSRENFNAEEFFKDVIGVTVSPNQDPAKVVLFVTHKHAQYVITKPLHNSQKIIEEDAYGIIIELEVQHNFELEKEILGLGDGVMVIAPERLKRSIQSRLNNAVDLYNTAIGERGIVTIKKKLLHKGFAVVNHLFSLRSMRKLASILYNAGVIDKTKKTQEAIALHDFPNIKDYVINKNIENIISQLNAKLSLKKVMFYQFVPDAFFQWSQLSADHKLVMLFFLEHSRIKSFPMQFIPGTFKKLLSPEEKALILENSVYTEINLQPGGALLMQPALLNRFPESLKNKNIRFLTLGFEV